MIVVADTSPVNYLILIEQIEVLARLYGKVLVPAAVKEELLRSAAPEKVRSWMQQPPDWVEVRATRLSADTTLQTKLDAGERDAILLAEETNADYVIIDELLGRREAAQRGLPVIGTIGVLYEAALAGLIDLRASITLLQATSFHLSPKTLTELLREFE